MIVEYTVENGEPVIHTYFRKGKERVHKTVYGIRPNFYVPDSCTIDESNFRIVDVEHNHKDMFGNKLSRIFCKLPKYVKDLKSEFQITYEADILYTDVYMNEVRPKFGDFPKVMYWDIEVFSKTGEFPKPDDEVKDTGEVIEGAKFPICGISFCDNYTNDYVTLFLDENCNDKIESKFWINRITKKKHIWKIYTFNREENLLNKFITFVRRINPDILTGWYSDWFDMPYTINRMKRLNLNYKLLSPLRYVDVPKPFETLRGTIIKKIPRIKGRYIFDLLIAYKKLYGAELVSYELDEISDIELGVKKVQYKGNIFQLYLNDKELFKEYNISDVELCKELDNKIKIIEKYYDLSKFINCTLDKTLSNSRMLDMYNLQYAKHIRKIALPSKTIHEDKPYKGAIVIEPKHGVHNNIIVEDLKRIYPNIIVSYNMSPETLVLNPNKDDDNIMIVSDEVGFRMNVEGFCSEVVGNLFKLRDDKADFKNSIKDVNSKEYDHAKRDEQYVKDLINSYYGDIGFVGSRLFNLHIADSVTRIGRRVIEWCHKEINENGYEVLYTDTDSIFLYSKHTEKYDDVKDLIKVEGKEISKLINISMNKFAKQYNIKEHKFSIDFEKIFETLVFVLKESGGTAKKKYFGLIKYLDGKDVNKKEFKNVEVMKSDSSKIIKEILNGIIDNIFDHKSEDYIISYINGMNSKLLNSDFYNIGMPKGIRQQLHTYKSKGAHVVGAIYSNKYLGTSFDAGSKPMYCYVNHNSFKCKKHHSTHVISYDMNTIIPDCFSPNYDIILKRLVINKINRLFLSIGWNLGDVKLGNQVKLSQFI